MKITLPSCSARHIGALCLAALLPLTSAHAALPGLAQTPLYLSTPVEPNIFFLHDDSHSMDYDQLIPGLDGTLGLQTALLDETGLKNDAKAITATGRTWNFRFYEDNPLYYNPKKIYNPWPGPNHNDGDKPFQNMPVTAARIELGMTNGAADTRVRDLTTQPTDLTKDATYYDTSEWTSWCATYAPGSTCRGWRYYEKAADNTVQVKWVADMDAAGKTNFANWYTYHRSRKNMAKNALGLAVKAATGKRLGFGGINDIEDGVTSDIAFIASDNSANVYKKLYNTMGAGNTPLRTALNRVGKYYEKGELISGTTTTSPILSLEKGGACQLNHTILITDGGYDDIDPTAFSGVGDADGDNNSAFDGSFYADKSPPSKYPTLADVAMHYYERDLRTDLPNKAKGADGASHQRMITSTISLGLAGTIPNPNAIDFSKLTSYPWPLISTQATALLVEAAKIDDLFHAAVNGRSVYVQAGDPTTLITALNNIVTGIQSPSNSSNAVATSAFRLGEGDLAITSSFDPGDWSGEIKAFQITDSDGSLNQTTPAWRSNTTLPFNATRQIITYDASLGVGTGIPFLWDKLNTTQRSSLGFTDDTEVGGDFNAYAKVRLNYLRGKTVTDPDTNDTITFRSRSVPLGDIVNSSPVHVGIPALRYPDAAPFGETNKRYGKFWNDNKDRTPVVYVGANDGMLHGFDANTGKELLAYVPNAVFTNLKYITDPSFVANHKYFVDQTPTVSDVYINGAWRTVLVGGLGGGGRGLFALNVTDPTTFTEAKAADIAMWEFTNANDADLGYTVAKPVIALAEMPDPNDNSKTIDKWIAITGNGYGAESGDAALFILTLNSTTSEHTKMVTGDQTDNGLFSPAAVDTDGNGKVDRVYAGDLLGNLWVFNLKTNTSWKLFTAKNSAGTKAQPITSKPSVTVHPTQATKDGNRPNMLVMFGTGSYLTSGDLSNSDEQSFYAVWDDGSSNLGRSNLAAQSFDQGIDGKLKIEARLTKNVDVKYSATDSTKQYGWYLDLDSMGTDPSERVVTSPTVRQGIVFFTTYIPSTDLCAGGGDSWFMTLKSTNGGPPDKPIISINNNREIEENVDIVTLNGNKSAPSGLKIEGGAFGATVTDNSVLINTVKTDKEMGNFALDLGAGSVGKRISWRELRRE